MLHATTPLLTWLALAGAPSAAPKDPHAQRAHVNPRHAAAPEVREWRIGMSTALTGPTANIGLGVRTGVEAAFAEFNAARPDGAPRLRLIALDDGYEPRRTAPNMHALIEQQGVLAVIGNVGTPTAIVAIPIAARGATPFIGAFTGAGVLREDPPERYVINFRASYAEEMTSIVDALIDQAGLDVEDVAFFTQRDGYGDSGFAGGLEALQRRGLAADADVVHARYERNTLAVEGGLAEILLAPRTPRAVILVGTSRPCARFIRCARDAGFDPLFLSVSFVGASELAGELGARGDGVIVTQVVPHFASELSITDAYCHALDRLDPNLQPSFSSLEGYVCGTLFCRALSRVRGEPTRESIVDSLLGLGTFDLGLGVPLRLDAQHHQACNSVWPTVLRGGIVQRFEWRELARSGGAH